MKLFCAVLIACVLLVGSSDPLEDAHLQTVKLAVNITSIVLNITQSFIDTLPGSLTLNSSTNMTLDDQIWKGTLNLSDIVLVGLNRTNVVGMDVSYTLLGNTNSSFNTTIELRRLNLSLSYAADLKIANFFPLFGTGLTELSIESLLLKLYFEIAISGLTIKGLQNLSILFAVGNNSQFQIDGVMNDPAMSEALSDVGDTLLVKSINQLNDYLKNTSQNISVTLQEAFNKLCPFEIPLGSS